jgi:hypothetical protein
MILTATATGDYSNIIFIRSNGRFLWTTRCPVTIAELAGYCGA